MKVYEYLTYLKKCSPNLKFKNVFFCCDGFYEGPYKLDCPAEEFLIYLQTEMGDTIEELSHKPSHSMLVNSGIKPEFIDDYICLEVEELN